LYNDLYKAWKSEKTSRETQPLPDDFYQKTEAYLSGLDREDASIDEHTAKGRLLLKEKEIATRLLRELKETRLRKLLAHAQNGETVDGVNLTEEERKLSKDIAGSIEAFEQCRALPSTPSAPEESVELCVVRFLEDIPEIVGTDLRIYGPYKKEDIGSLPTQNATALVKQGAAKQIEVRSIARSVKKSGIERQQQ
jgi:DNA replication factor GINS